MTDDLLQTDVISLHFELFHIRLIWQTQKPELFASGVSPLMFYVKVVETWICEVWGILCFVVYDRWWKVVVLLPLVVMVLVHILHITGFCSSSLRNPNHCQMTDLMLFFFRTKTSVSISITYSLHSSPDTKTRMRAVVFWMGGGVYCVLQEERVRGKCLEKYIRSDNF